MKSKFTLIALLVLSGLLAFATEGESGICPGGGELIDLPVSDYAVKADSRGRPEGDGIAVDAPRSGERLIASSDGAVQDSSRGKPSGKTTRGYSFNSKMGTGYDFQYRIEDERYVFAANEKAHCGVEFLDWYDGEIEVVRKWYRPDGSYSCGGSRYWPDPEDVYGEGRGYAWARGVFWLNWGGGDPGNWRVDVHVNGSIWASHNFTLMYNLNDHKICEDIQSEDPWLPVNPRNVFSATDEKVTSWLELGNVTMGAEIKWEWYYPDGSLYFTHEADWQDPSPDSWWNWYRGGCYISIAGSTPAAHPGNWTVKVT